MEHARQPRRTDIFDVIDPSQDSTGQTRTADLSADDEAGSDGELMILAVRKVQETFPSMITAPKARSSFFRNVMPWRLCAPLGKPVNARGARAARVPGAC